MSYIKQTLYLTLLCVFSIASAFAQEQNNNSLLWKIEGKSLAQASYLFGTVHIICESDYKWTPAMNKAFNSANTVAFEMDVTDSTLSTNIMMGLLLKDKTASDFYTERELNKVKSFSEQYQIPPMIYQNMHPFALMSMLYLHLLPCNNPTSYEVRLASEAKNKSKAIIGLETKEEQLNVALNMDERFLVKSIISITDNIDSAKREYQKIYTSYKNQDITAINKAVEEAPDYALEKDNLIFKRNNNWIPKILMQCTQNSTFFAVGAAHLAGEHGLISLLRKQGYTLTPIK